MSYRSDSALRRRTTGLLSGLICCLALLVGQVGVSAPAQAHASLTSSSPAADATVDSAPSDVVLEFSDAINEPAFVSVTAPDGTLVAEGEAAVDGTTVEQSVPGPGQQGVYRVDYRIVSTDGHPVEGDYEFEVTSGAAAAGEDTSQDGASQEAQQRQASSQQEASTNTPLWWAVGIGAWLVAILGIAMVVRRRT